MVFGRRNSGSARGFSWAPEVMVITAAAPVLGSLVNPADPYLLHSPFPWLMLAPLAVALQHGLWAGLTSSAVLCGLAGWQAMSAGAVPASFASWSIGCGLTALIAGQIRDSVRGRTEKLAKRAEHLQDRLERSERSRHLVQLSHAKLEERVVSNRTSLAAAIDDAERRIAGGHSMHELGQILLDVLATQGHLHAASLYVAGREPGLLLSEPVASFGGTGASSSQHALVVRAFKTGKLAAIVDGLEAARSDTSVLAAVPLITARRRTVGVVAIHQMPFMMFHADHLNQVFVLAGHLADLLFDRWSEVHGAPQYGLEVADSAGLRVRRPVVSVEAVVEPVLPPVSNEVPAVRAMDGMERVTVSGVHAAADVESVTISNAHAAADVDSVTISNAHVASDTVSVNGARAERIEILLSPEANAPVAAAESAANQPTMHMIDDTSIEIPITIVLEEPAPAVIAPVAPPDAEPVVVGVFERGSVVARETIAFDAGSLETSSPAAAAHETVAPAIIAPAATPKSRKSSRTAVAARSVETRKNARTAEITKSRKTARAAEAASVEPNAAATTAPAVTQAATSDSSLAVSVAERASGSGLRTSGSGLPATRSPQSEACSLLASGAQYLQMNARRSQSTMYEASRVPASLAQTRKRVRLPLPAPVENARTAILAAFARQANSEAVEAQGSALPSSIRATRAVFGGYRPVPASLLRAAVQPSAATTRDSRPATATAAKAAPSAPPAKAEDARASVRAAFAKTRTPAPAEEETAVAATAFESAYIAATPRGDEPRATGLSAHAAATPRGDEPRATGLSIDEARAALLATLATARALPRKPRANGRPAAPAAHKRASGTNAVAANPIAGSQAAQLNPTDASSAAQHAQATRSTPTPDATPAIRAEVEHAPANGSRSTSTTSQPAPRRTLLPPPPAPAGFAAVQTVAHPVTEPRSRTQSTRPQTDTAPSSSTSL